MVLRPPPSTAPAVLAYDARRPRTVVILRALLSAHSIEGDDLGSQPTTMCTSLVQLMRISSGAIATLVSRST